MFKMWLGPETLGRRCKAFAEYIVAGFRVILSLSVGIIVNFAMF